MSEYKLLSSGSEFFDDLLKEIKTAQKTIVIKAFLWRNDECGQCVANAVREAADRGVKVSIIKDRIGAFYEYGEGNGQSFFHDNPYPDHYFSTHGLYSIYIQSRFFSWFYGNERSRPAFNPYRKSVVGNLNIRVLDQYKLYDHSKVIMIDGNVSYLGGIGFGNEFFLETKDKWIDYMVKIRGTQNKELHFIIDRKLQEKGSSIHKYTLQFIAEAKEKLVVQMPFLGHPDYINALTERVKHGVKVIIIMPKRAASHHWRNLHFIKRLRRQASRSPLLEVVTTDGMVHSKVILRDDRAIFFGSHNLSFDDSTFNETNIMSTEPTIVNALREKVMQNYQDGERHQESLSWLKILPPSRAEFVMVKYQTFIKWVRRKKIETAHRKAIIEA